MKTILQLREYYDTFTESELYVPDIKEVMWVLEDMGRPQGVKIDGKTCIPEGVYDVSISKSTRFKKDMMLLSNQQDKSISDGVVKFTGVRPHGGNKTEDTEGCPLCNFHTDHEGKQWGRASDLIFQHVKGWLDQGEVVKWVITS